MKNKIKNLVLLFATISMLSSCVNDSFDIPKDECVSPGLIKNKEVAAIYTMASNTTAIYTADDIIEAYMISSDEGGNFFKNMYLQPTDGSKGFNVSVEDGNVYTKSYQPGKKVYIKLKGLAYANPTSFARGLIIGAPPTSIFAVDRIPTLDYTKFLIPSCDIISEDQIVHPITIAQAIANDTYLNTLVEFDNVQFESDSGTYDTNRNDNSDSSINLTNGANTIALRTSRFANFAGNNIPSGRGKIRGVLTKYGTGSNPYQLVIRTERDVNMKNPRVDYTLPIVGNANTFSATVNEPFSSYTVGQNNFPKYINDVVVGFRYWQVKSFSNNNYIEMSAFNGSGNPGVSSKTYFLVPIDFTAASTFTFKEEIRFNAGEALKVYYVTSANYTAGGIINLANFTNITSSFNITYPALGSSENVFNSAGTYSIPTTLTGTGYFVFEYTGTSTVTTTVQIDDIIIN